MLRILSGLSKSDGAQSCYNRFFNFIDSTLRLSPGPVVPCAGTVGV
jgi:hypothetical protein